ncbi:hypothetical protein [uncultured Mucilaginibacter sp.]|uniref:hypothetical protein n=1 Tax=uncultured Mucilaginibacter sp. TaxID=797541 RepID=UPI0025E3A8CF|nr:hypothetical protein [uncultured Mucilaginibacter sp.]
MVKYHNLSGNSGVEAYETGNDNIKIRFKGGDVYLYSYTKPGKRHVEQMKRLATIGEGLATYISRSVKNNFEAKL